ncbi:MAG: YraN family protein [Gammaproteobacteria bacterium]|nr:YraN family protein [Gammaproteobacteria bacterium]
MVNPSSSVDIGTLAEYDACAFLKKQRLILVKKNFIAYTPAGKKAGEIDLIMRDGKYYVFIEVKSRRYDSHGDVLEMVTPQKQSRVITACKYFLLQKGLWDRVLCRFDVVGISPGANEPIVWIKDAFQVQY